MNRRSLFRFLTGVLVSLGLRKVPAAVQPPELPKPWEWPPIWTDPNDTFEPTRPIGPGPWWRINRDFHPLQRNEVYAVIKTRAERRGVREQVLHALDASRDARLTSRFDEGA